MVEHLHADHSDLTAAEAAERVLTLAAALNAHDHRTRGHSERVRALTDLVAHDMALERTMPTVCDGLRCSTTSARLLDPVEITVPDFDLESIKRSSDRLPGLSCCAAPATSPTSAARPPLEAPR